LNSLNTFRKAQFFQAWPRGRLRSTRGEEHVPSSLSLLVFPFWPFDSLIRSI